MEKIYQQLYSEAVNVAEKSYSPYSHFRVGAALLCSDGSIYTGCNIENASFSLTNCAERTAFFKAVSEGRKDFEAIAIAGGETDFNNPCYPCGACRQVMVEFCNNDFKIILSDRIVVLKDIFPDSFRL